MKNSNIIVKNLVIVLIIVGVLGLIGKWTEKNKNSEEMVKGKNYFEISHFMGGSKKKFGMEDFKGGEFSAVMGGGEIDLTECQINGDAEINVFCLMGGGQIMVPKEWNIEMDVTAIMGGSDVKGDLEASQVNKISNLKITGTTIMGGLEVVRK